MQAPRSAGAGCKRACARRSLRAGAELAGVHNRTLHDALHAFAEQAAWQLAAEVADGAEVPFELVEARGRAPRVAVLPTAR